jgi:hypothetical protein
MNTLMAVAVSAVVAATPPDHAQSVRGDEVVVTSRGSTTARPLKDRFGDERDVKDFGAKGDGITDDTLAIQAALDSTDDAGTKHAVYLPAGTYLVSSTLTLKTGTRIRGESYVSTRIKMKRIPVGPKPKYVGSTRYPVTLEYFPILWNASPVQWFVLEGVTLDGNGLDVYGLRLQEDYYGDIANVQITGCARHPYVNVRAQLVNHRNLAIYDNGDGALFFDSTAITIAASGFERNKGAYYLQMRQPSRGFNKGSLSISGLWFEGAPGKRPGVGFLGVGGRAVAGSGLFFTAGDADSRDAAIRFLDSDDTIVVDGITMQAAPAQGAELRQVNYATSMSTYFGRGTAATYVSGHINASMVVDASGNDTNQLRAVGSGMDWDYVLGRFQVRKKLGAGISVAPQSYILDVQDEAISLFGQADNSFRSDEGALELRARQSLRLLAGNAPGQNVVVGSRNGTSNHELGHLVLGGLHVWKDAENRLRAHASSPAVDTDGYPFSQFVKVPNSANAQCAAGQWSADASFAYFCYEKDHWRRMPVSAW